MANPSDTTYAIIKETTAGTTPSTPTFLSLDHIAGDSPIFTSDFITSNVVKPSRAAGQSRKAGYRVEGSIRTQLQRSASLDLLMESACSGSFSEGELAAGKTDTNLTVEKRMIEGAGSLYSRYVGLQVTRMNISGDASSPVEASFEFLGLNRTVANSAIASSTYTPMGNAVALTGLDVETFSIEGLDVDVRSFDLSVTHDRQTKDVFGSAAPIGIGTSGLRSVTLSCQFYREDFDPETALDGDTPVAISFAVGEGSNGYQFDLPAAVGTVPVDQEDGARQLVSVEFTAMYDETAETDLIITKLTDE